MSNKNDETLQSNLTISLYYLSERGLNKRPSSFSCTAVGFSSGSVLKNLPASEGDSGSVPDPGRPHMPRSS